MATGKGSHAGSFAAGFVQAYLAARRLAMQQKYFESMSQLRQQQFDFENARWGYDPKTHMFWDDKTGGYTSHIPTGNVNTGASDTYSGGFGSSPGPGTPPVKGEDTEMRDHIVQWAQDHGKNPEEALALWRTESGGGTNMQGDKGPDGRPSSFSDFQFHFGGINPNMPNAGMGDDFLKATGIDLRTDSSKEARFKAADYALDRMSTNGFGDWATSQKKLGLGAKWSDAGKPKAEKVAAKDADKPSKDATPQGSMIRTQNGEFVIPPGGRPEQNQQEQQAPPGDDRIFHPENIFTGGRGKSLGHLPLVPSPEPNKSPWADAADPSQDINKGPPTSPTDVTSREPTGVHLPPGAGQGQGPYAGRPDPGIGQGPFAGRPDPGIGQGPFAGRPDLGIGQGPFAGRPDPGIGQGPYAGRPDPGIGQGPYAGRPDPGIGQGPYAGRPDPGIGQGPYAGRPDLGIGQGPYAGRPAAQPVVTSAANKPAPNATPVASPAGPATPAQAIPPRAGMQIITQDRPNMDVVSGPYHTGSGPSGGPAQMGMPDLSSLFHRGQPAQPVATQSPTQAPPVASTPESVRPPVSQQVALTGGNQSAPGRLQSVAAPVPPSRPPDVQAMNTAIPSRPGMDDSMQDDMAARKGGAVRRPNGYVRGGKVVQTGRRY